jgi:hypothetical protein
MSELVAYELSNDMEEKLQNFTVEDGRKIMRLGHYDEAFLICLPIVIVPGFDLREEYIR